MPDREELRRTYSGLATERLLAIVTAQAAQYEEMAVETAREELRQRGVDPAQPNRGVTLPQAASRVPFALECSCNGLVKGCLIVMPGKLYFLETPPEPLRPMGPGLAAWILFRYFSLGHRPASRDDPDEKLGRLGVDLGAGSEHLSQQLDTYAPSGQPPHPASGRPMSQLYRAALESPELQTLTLDGSCLIATSANG